MRTRDFLASFIVLLLSFPLQAEVILDYTHDSYFATNATARAAVEAAVADVNAVLNFAGTATTDRVTVTAPGGSFVELDFEFEFTNPTTGIGPTITPIAALAANEIRVYAGVRQLDGVARGAGTPGAAVYSGVVVSAGPADLAVAVASANAQAAAVWGRGDGPVVSTLEGAFGGDDFNVGPTVASVSFDSDTNDDGVTDFDNWHFDHTTAVEAGKRDLYSVALTEVLTSIGFGTSISYNDLVQGNDWTGANVIALNGTGSGIIDSNGTRIANNVLSTSIVDGSVQEVALSSDGPELGTRTFLTDLDVAFLQDIGFANASATTAVPEPSSLALMLLAGVVGLRRQRRASK